MAACLSARKWSCKRRSRFARLCRSKTWKNANIKQRHSERSEESSYSKSLSQERLRPIRYCAGTSTANNPRKAKFSQERLRQYFTSELEPAVCYDLKSIPLAREMTIFDCLHLGSVMEMLAFSPFSPYVVVRLGNV